MKLSDIKTAVLAGRAVYWRAPEYRVQILPDGRFAIVGGSAWPQLLQVYDGAPFLFDGRDFHMID